VRVDEHGVEWFDLALREDREAFVRAVDALPDPDADEPEPVAPQGKQPALGVM